MPRVSPERPCRDHPPNRPRLVVGVDGSTSSVAALRWALRVARERAGKVEVVTAWPEPEVLFVHDVPGHFCAPRYRADTVQSEALDSAGCVEDLSVSISLENAHPVDALLARCGPGDVLVLGAGAADRDQRPGRVDVVRLCSLLATCAVVVVES